MATTFYSAKNAKIRYVTGGVTYVLAAKSWNVNVDADDLETTNFESAGFHENITGIRKLTFSIELDDNGSQNSFDIGFKAGTIFGLLTSGPLYLYLNDTSGPKWVITNAFMKTVGHKADVKTTMGLTIQGNGTGTFTYPTGSAGTTT